MRRALVLPLLLLATSAGAQEVPALILSGGGGVAVPLGAFADDGAKVGWSVDASVSVRITRLLGVYGSYERASFGVADGAANPGDGNWVDSGVGVGGQLWVPVRDSSRLQPWLRLGIGWHNLDPLLAGGDLAHVDTDGISTLEGGAGVEIALPARGLFLRPTARYRHYSFKVEANGRESSTSVSELTVDLGLTYVLGLGKEPASATTRSN